MKAVDKFGVTAGVISVFQTYATLVDFVPKKLLSRVQSLINTYYSYPRYIIDMKTIYTKLIELLVNINKKLRVRA